MITAHFYCVLQLQAQKKINSKNGCYHGKAILEKTLKKEDKRTLPKQGGSCHGGVCQTLLEQTMRQKTNKKHERDGGGVKIPESVAETPDTEERPAGEALHFGMPLNGGSNK